MTPSLPTLRSSVLFDPALRRAGHGEIQLRGEFTLGKKADTILAAAGHAGGLKRGVIDGRLGVELLRVDQLLDHAQIDDREVLAEDVVEAALQIGRASCRERVCKYV